MLVEVNVVELRVVVVDVADEVVVETVELVIVVVELVSDVVVVDSVVVLVLHPGECINEVVPLSAGTSASLWNRLQDPSARVVNNVQFGRAASHTLLHTSTDAVGRTPMSARSSPFTSNKGPLNELPRHCGTAVTVVLVAVVVVVVVQASDDAKLLNVASWTFVVLLEYVLQDSLDALNENITQAT